MGSTVTSALLLTVLLALGAVAAADADIPPLFKYTLKRRSPGRPSLKDMHHRRASEQTPTEEVKIFGDFKELAYYYADVFVGTPPQKVTVITDTGSTLLAFPCTGCSHCGSHMDPRYDASRSSTSSEVGCGGGCPGSCSSNQCTYHVAYAEGSSISGYYHEDLVWIGDETTATVEAGAQYGTRYKFGCHTQETKLFLTQDADGIMGLSQEPGSLMSTLAATGKLRSHMFSMCLTFDGGAFILGGVEERMHTGPIQWTPLTPSRNFFTIVVTGASLGTWSTAASTRFQAIVDSGTTFTYLPPSLFREIRTHIRSWCAEAPSSRCLGSSTRVENEDMCYTLASATDILTFPTVTFTFDGGMQLEITPERLFVDMAWDGRAHCLAIYANNDDSAVMGANAMMGNDVIFNLEANDRKVGFAPATCIVPPAILYDSPTASPSNAPSQSSAESTTPTAAASESGTASPSISTSASNSPAPSTSPSTSGSASNSPDPIESDASGSSSVAGTSPSATPTAAVPSESASPAAPASAAASASPATVPESSSPAAPESVSATASPTRSEGAALINESPAPVTIGQKELKEGAVGFLSAFAVVSLVVGAVVLYRRRRRASQGFTVLETSEVSSSNRRAGTGRYRDEEDPDDGDDADGEMDNVVDRRSSRQRASGGDS